MLESGWLIGIGAVIFCIYSFTSLRSITHFECSHATEMCTYQVMTLMGTKEENVKISDIEGIDIESRRGRRSGTKYHVVLVTPDGTMRIHENSTSSLSREQRLASELYDFVVNSSKAPFTYDEDNRQLGTTAGVVAGVVSVLVLTYAWRGTLRFW